MSKSRSVYRQVRQQPKDEDASVTQDKKAKLSKLNVPTVLYEVYLKDDSIFFDVMKMERGMTEQNVECWRYANSTKRVSTMAESKLAEFVQV